MIANQRKHTRLLPQENTFAAIGREFTKVGKVKDISIGGLAIEYIVGEDENHRPSQVDIFMSGQVFHLNSLPCKLVYDMEVHVPHVNNQYVKLLTTKRCGVQFEELSDHDQAQLEIFLESCTSGPT